VSAWVGRVRRGEPLASGLQLYGEVRLDGREALAGQLRDAGLAADPRDDTALVLAAYRAWGENMLPRLLGDYAFAVWDPERRLLFCARDPFGVKPFYYAGNAEGFTASSSLTSVRREAGIGSQLDESSIVSFLRWGVVVDVAATSFAAIRRLPPGHLLRVNQDGSASDAVRWWNFPDPPPLRLRDDREYLDGMREMAGQAVLDRLRSTHGAILMSGGVDSTGLAAAARRFAPEVELTAYTLDFSELAPSDEVSFAALAASALGVRTEVVVDNPVVFEDHDNPAWATPEPHDHTEHMMWRRLAARVAARAPVLMIGEDGDSLLKPPSLAGTAKRWGTTETIHRLGHFLLTRRRKPHTGLRLRQRIRDRFGQEGDGSMPPWVRADVVARTGTQESIEDRSHPSRPEAAGRLTAPVWPSMLERSDTEYSGAPLEVVWPLLDLRVLHFTLGLPPIPWLQQKEIWREAWRGAVPDAVLDRPKTTLRGVAEARVTRWRAATKGCPIVWSKHTADFVDTRRVGDMLQRGGVGEVIDAWRAVALDRWLRTIE
jgi:asparagine synthase (glutamine-hydrolysing)